MNKEEKKTSYYEVRATTECPYCGYSKTMEGAEAEFIEAMKDIVVCIHCGKEFLIEENPNY